jgi:hypothetical protein
VGIYPFHRENQLVISFSGKYHGEIQLGDELGDYALRNFNSIRTSSFGTGLALRDILAARAEASKY